jgi:DNA polymerase I-like protein with 3'-5' exonuclease and polymerase domains
MEYILLEQQRYAPVDPELVYKPSDIQLDMQLSSFDGPLLSFDFETTGLSAHDDEAVSIGLCDGIKTVSIYFKDRAQCVKVCHWLLTKKLIGYNFIFDGLFITKYTGQVPWPHRDAMVMFKALANEGITGQSWSLKRAMTDVLGWSEQNDVEMKAYMKEHKCAMHEVPWTMLCHYNGLDALATWQLYEYLEARSGMFPALADFWDTEWAHLIAMLIEQHWLGISVSEKHYSDHLTTLQKEQAELLDLFFIEVGPHIDEFNRLAVESVVLARPRNPIKKDGTEAKSMEKYYAKIEAAKLANHFNTDSNEHLCWLFYDRLGYPVAKRTPSGAPSVAKATLHNFDKPGKLLAKYRKKRDEAKFVVNLLASIKESRVHCDIRVHGTISGRCSSGSELT